MGVMVFMCHVRPSFGMSRQAHLLPRMTMVWFPPSPDPPHLCLRLSAPLLGFPFLPLISDLLSVVLSMSPYCDTFEWIEMDIRGLEESEIAEFLDPEFPDVKWKLPTQDDSFEFRNVSKTSLPET